MPVAARLQRFPTASCRLFVQTRAQPEGGLQAIVRKCERSEPIQERGASVSSWSHLKKGVASQAAMRGKLNAGYPPHVTAGMHWSKDTLGVSPHRPCPLRLDAAQPKRLASGRELPSLYLFRVSEGKRVARYENIFGVLCSDSQAHVAWEHESRVSAGFVRRLAKPCEQ